MARRLWRWAGYVLVPGVVPFLLVYLVNAIAGDRPLTAFDVLRDGDAILIAVMWSVAALAELPDQPLGPLRGAVRYLCCALLFVGCVAYGCLTTVSVTGREQTRVQQDFVAAMSFGFLVAGAGLSTWAAGLGTRRSVADGTPGTTS